VLALSPGIHDEGIVDGGASNDVDSLLLQQGGTTNEAGAVSLGASCSEEKSEVISTKSEQ